jgi:hypothetical protein
MACVFFCRHFVIPRKDKMISMKLQGENSTHSNPRGIPCLADQLAAWYFCPKLKRGSHEGLQHKQKEGIGGEKNPTSIVFSLLEKALKMRVGINKEPISLN